MLDNRILDMDLKVELSDIESLKQNLVVYSRLYSEFKQQEEAYKKIASQTEDALLTLRSLENEIITRGKEWFIYYRHKKRPVKILGYTKDFSRLVCQLESLSTVEVKFEEVYSYDGTSYRSYYNEFTKQIQSLK